MKRTKYIYLTLLGALFLIITSCETVELDLAESPNTLTPDGANPLFVLNQVQLDLQGVFAGLSNDGMEITRQTFQFDSYASNITNVTLNNNNVWTLSYRINNNRIFLDQLAQTDSNIEKLSGVADLLTAYTFVSLTDYVGDIPFSQSSNPSEFPLPGLDSDEDVYDQMFDLIDQGTAKLRSSSPNTLSEDLYYDGDISLWLRMANTLRLKMYNQIRVVDPARATAGVSSVLASSDGLITESSQDLQFSYTNVGPPVDSRHRFFINSYLVGGAAITTYMNNEYMERLKSNDDPRLRYYFYRQSLIDPVGDNLPCTDPEPLFDCYIDNFYWGRNHANGDGIPNDNSLRTVYGLYPAGGSFDSNPNAVGPDDQTLFPGVDNTGLGGAGIDPILMSSFTNFYLAETALTLGVGGDPRTLLEEAVTQSINKVFSFGTTAQSDQATENVDVPTFIANVLASYDAAASDNERLEVILTQFHIAAFGNGIESYNFYRKTGLPTFQAPVNNTPFPRSFLIPTDETETNSNIEVNSITDQLFWDTNPAGFIN